MTIRRRSSDANTTNTYVDSRITGASFFGWFSKQRRKGSGNCGSRAKFFNPTGVNRNFRGRPISLAPVDLPPETPE